VVLREYDVCRPEKHRATSFDHLVRAGEERGLTEAMKALAKNGDRRFPPDSREVVEDHVEPFTSREVSIGVEVPSKHG
jgi:hypothetical protein